MKIVFSENLGNLIVVNLTLKYFEGKGRSMGIVIWVFERNAKKNMIISS
jgi:hypothetical protein